MLREILESINEASDFAKSALKSVRANIKRRKFPIKVKIKTLNKANDIHVLKLSGQKLSSDDIKDMKKWLSDDKMKINSTTAKGDVTEFEIQPK